MTFIKEKLYVYKKLKFVRNVSWSLNAVIKNTVFTFTFYFILTFKNLKGKTFKFWFISNILYSQNNKMRGLLIETQ